MVGGAVTIIFCFISEMEPTSISTATLPLLLRPVSQIPIHGGMKQRTDQTHVFPPGDHILHYLRNDSKHLSRSVFPSYEIIPAGSDRLSGRLLHHCTSLTKVSTHFNP